MYKQLYTVRIAALSPTVDLIGKAAIGSSESASVWQIVKLDQTTGLKLTYVDGSAGSFNYRWDLKDTYQYS